jgi:hypothetical protein
MSDGVSAVEDVRGVVLRLVRPRHFVFAECSVVLVATRVHGWSSISAQCRQQVNTPCRRRLQSDALMNVQRRFWFLLPSSKRDSAAGPRPGRVAGRKPFENIARHRQFVSPSETPPRGSSTAPIQSTTKRSQAKMAKTKPNSDRTLANPHIPPPRQSAKRLRRQIQVRRQILLHQPPHQRRMLPRERIHAARRIQQQQPDRMLHQ